MKVSKYLEFTCPKCGCHYYGTEMTQHNREIRHCHGDNCNFSCRAENDYLYFRQIIEIQYESAEEYLKGE